MAIYFWTGLAFLKAGNIEVTGQRITGWSFVLTGLHFGNYPLLRNVEWFAPWGYLIAGAMAFLLAIGILLVYYQQIKNSLTESETRLQLLAENAQDLIYRYRLIQDLFDLAQLESRRVKFNLEQVAVNDLILQLFDKYRVDVLNAGLRFNLNSPAPREPDSSETMPTVEVDPDQIERVFANLIYNAVKHTPQGRTVSVGYKIVQVDGGRASRARTGTGAGCFEALVKVTDTGTGISPKELPYIFNRYYKGAATAEKTGGTGLGLAISKEIIEYHNGRIWAESVLNQGSTFCFAQRLISP
ncbi:MAG: Sensor histidine kinase YycG [Pelotomaculum sp. PtaB.Bin117]|nr:MAG: Sensor histidine kinase YycG [Pelotomaculum sp. PtaB.Bin117]OPY62175.1 MAG: Sensor histidine kinase YycG [Pelotomaculum sp. PtaU1.Bin065]